MLNNHRATEHFCLEAFPFLEFHFCLFLCIIPVISFYPGYWQQHPFLITLFPDPKSLLHRPPLMRPLVQGAQRFTHLTYCYLD